MKRLTGFSVLAVAFAAVTLVAQDAGSVAQTPVTDAKAVPAAASQAPATGDSKIEAGPATIQAGPEKMVTDPSVTKLPGDTHVRIVRLSQAQGKVGMDRGSGHGLEQAMQNMPIVEGMVLGTANDSGYAEVEFEDGSTMRLGPGSAVKFSQLVTRATGAKATVVRVDRGTVYVSRESTKADEFTLAAVGVRKIEVLPGTHLRLEMEGTKAEVAVFSGNASVTASGEPVIVAKKQTLLMDVADLGNKGELTKKVDEAPFDGWDNDLQRYHDQYAKRNALLGGNGFGVSDLNYYGSFITAGGCGTFWQPYFASASWNPYGAGLWAQYGAGYSWVSPYPWGWLPYHSGGWSYCPSYGWGWQPGGSFVGLNNIAGIAVPVRDGTAHIPGGLLPRPPADAKASMVVVNSQSLVASKPEAGGSFRFQRDSAGLGVPRGSLGKLNGISNDVAKNGFANRAVYMAPAGEASHWNDGQVYRGPLTMHKGSMPDEARQAMWARQQQAAANGSLNAHPDGQLGAGMGRGTQPTAGQSPSAGWQGRPGQPGPANNGANSLGWKGNQGGANGAANANASHSWNNGGSGAGAGAGAAAGGHTWNGGANANGGANPGASTGGGHWNGGGGQGSMNGGGGGHWNGGGAGGGNSAGAGSGGGHSGGGGNPSAPSAGGSSPK